MNDRTDARTGAGAFPGLPGIPGVPNMGAGWGMGARGADGDDAKGTTGADGTVPDWLSISQELMGAGQEWVRQAANINPFLKLFPFNYSEMGRALMTISTDLALNPARARKSWMELVEKQFGVLMQSSRQAWGLDYEAVVEPSRRDKRFSDEAWSKYALFNAIKQSYLINYGWFMEQLDGNDTLSPQARRRASFYLRQFLDSVSPSNSLFLNPVVLEETAKSRGKNLVSGLHNLVEDLKEGRVAMVEGSGFEFGRNIAASEGQVVLRTPILELIQYAPTTEQVYERPLMIIPPWINKYYILDLQPKNSLVKYLTDQGYTVFMVSWKNPDETYLDFSMEDYLTQGLLPASDAARGITGSDDLNVVGYCIGGTLLSLGLAALAAKGDKRFNTATFFVSLQDFEDPGDLGVFIDEPQLTALERRMSERGYLAAEDMSSAMNLLRANDLIWNYVVNNYLLGKQPMAFDLLYWNADGTRMALKTHTYYLRNMYLENNLVKPGRLEMLGEPIDLGKIELPIYAVGTQEDHIVPWRSAFKLRRYVTSPVRFILANSGHIAGVVSPPGGKGVYNTNDSTTTDAQAWLDGATSHKGSWWDDWNAWLAPQSGERVAPPSLGNADYKPLEPAPGTYVKEGVPQPK